MKKMKKQRGVLARVTTALLGEELPISLPGEYYLELVEGGDGARALISGVDRLLVCTPEEVSVAKKGKRLRVCGDELRCLTYSGGTLEVSGNVCTVLIEKEKPL